VTRFTRCVFAFAIVVDLVAAAINASQGRGWLGAFHLGLVVGLGWMWVRTERRIRHVRTVARRAQLIVDSLDAPRPEGVKVLRADGTVMPCELVYRGREDDGQHLWEVAGMVLQPGDQLYADVMPGHTGISIGFKEEW
jgi:hypothetical protein